MFTTYRAAQGDTFETVARRVYGDDAQAWRVRSANPGLSEPLQQGAELYVPPLPDAPRDRASAIDAADPDECALVIDDKRFRFWDSVVITRTVDSFDTMTFSAPFDPQDRNHRETFRPFSYKRAEFTVGGASLFSGTLINVDPHMGEDSTVVEVAGYATPGVLNDCSIPASAFPLQFVNSTFDDITRRVCDFFGVTYHSDAPAGPQFERVRCEYGQTALSFLTGLAKQRGVVLGSDPDGRLVSRQMVSTGNPVARLSEGSSPLERTTPQYNAQQCFSHITGIEPVVVGATGAQYTVKNPHIRGIVRPHTFTVRDAVGGDVQPATEAEAGRMLGGVASFVADVTTWRTQKGGLWEPNTVVTLTAPSAMVYEEYAFIIRRVTFKKDAEAKTASLELCLPGALSGNIPETLPWD